MIIHKNLNNLFEKDSFIGKLLMTKAYSNLIDDKNKYGFIGDLTSDSFDHTTTIKLREKIFNAYCSDTVRGIVTFPYFHDWDEIKRWIEKVPEKSYSVYILNPVLIFYGLGTVGLFLTPKYWRGYNIEMCNRLTIALTGFPLFLTFSDEDEVDEINKIDLGLCMDDFVNILYDANDKNKGLLKILNFWKDNDEVSIPSLEKKYDVYNEAQPFIAHIDTLFMKIISKKEFIVVHEDTKNILGLFKEFYLNGDYQSIIFENGEIKLSDNEFRELLDGKYDFLMVNV